MSVQSGSSTTHKFPKEQTCPKCGGHFSAAERQTQYDPVVVVLCPHCSVMLWLPGLDGETLYVFDPNVDADGI